MSAPRTEGAPVRRSMDAELVRRAQRGDEEAFASLAVAIGNRLHAVSHRILRDIDLAEDATQQALLAIWRDLPQLRDADHFEAWAYRLLVRACYAEGRRSRRWAPNLRILPVDEPPGPDASGTVVDRDQLERGHQAGDGLSHLQSLGPASEDAGLTRIRHWSTHTV